LCRLAVDADNHDLLVEILGTLANLTSLDIPVNQGWSKLLGDYNLLSLISKLLVPGMAQNDVLLEVIMLISAAASDNTTCSVLASSNIIGLLYQVWKDKSSDVEILLQLIYCFYKFFLQESSQDEAMYGTRVVIDIMECLSHKNSAVRSMADTVVELVLEVDRQANGQLGQLGEQIRKKRFESYTQRWLAEMKIIDHTSGSSSTVGARKDYNMYDDEYYNKQQGDIDMLADVEHEDMQWNDLMEHRQRLGQLYDNGSPTSDNSGDYDDRGYH
jgi:hypothetical protein